MKNATLKTSILIAFTLNIVLFIIPSRTAAVSYEIDSSRVHYLMNGKYDEGDPSAFESSSLTVSTEFFIDVDVNGSDVNITSVYKNIIFNGNLPYDIPDDVFVLTSGEISSKTKDDVNLTQDTEMNPFFYFFGISYLYGILETEETILRCKWDRYKGILLHMEIEKKKEVYTVLKVQYVGSSIDLYENYTRSQIEHINTVRFLFSAWGFALIASLCFAAVLIPIMIFKIMKKKKKRITEIRKVKRR